MGGHEKDVLDTEADTDNKERRGTMIMVVKTRTGLSCSSLALCLAIPEEE